MTRAYCKRLLCETFTALLLPDSVPDKQISSDFALQAFKQTLNLAKEASTTLVDSQSGGKLLSTAAGISDSGVFTIYKKNMTIHVCVHIITSFLRNSISIDDLMCIEQDSVFGLWLMIDCLRLLGSPPKLSSFVAFQY